jgi:hypothetical protein
VGEEPSYPTRMPPAAAGPPSTVPVPVPREVRHAVTLWVASIIVGLVGGTVSFVLANPLAAGRSRMQATTTSGLSPAQLDTIRNVSFIVGAVFGILFLALEVFFVVKMRAGRNWARIVLTVWFGIGVAGTLLSFAFQFLLSAMPITLVSGVLSVALLGFAVRLMYRPAANAYFTPPHAVTRPADLWQQPPAPQRVYGQRFDVVVPSSYAPWHIRALSGLIDHGVPTVIFFVFYVPFGSGTHGMGGNQGLLIMLAVIAVLIAVQVWNSAFRQGATGQSWGKQVAHTRLIDEWTGQPLGAGKAFLRLLAHFLDSAPCYLGWLFPLWDRPKRQTFADKIMHTIVVPAGETTQPPQQHGSPGHR